MKDSTVWSLVVLLLLLNCCLIGCVSAHSVSVEDRKDISKSLSYFKDIQHNLCYATITSTNGHLGEIISIASVPCTEDIK